MYGIDGAGPIYQVLPCLVIANRQNINTYYIQTRIHTEDETTYNYGIVQQTLLSSKYFYSYIEKRVLTVRHVYLLELNTHLFALHRVTSLV